ncbi:HK97 gp10 family phage protein [Lysinibacillus sphaericus]|uniref:HK97 gp10 family phage protein n=1 Tax=Lysinibacillus sphaericus TaxID=1421 RepID=UPI0019103205|nr:HK97 gp10 family phage protein [Lysinibacillus sphaericus]QPA56307.1 HK97 gp10 family phage protein [Lysinibacillus sphaericus]
MGRGGRVDLRELKAFERKLAKLARGDFERFCEAAAKELAARLLGKVIRRTPVGIVDGGTLRRGWTAKTHAEAESGSSKNAKEYAESLSVQKQGNVYELSVINPVEYAQYIEFGHRTSNHQGWVEGRFMMTISADEVEQQAPAILERKLFEMLRESFDGD